MADKAFQISTPGGYEVEVKAANEGEALALARKNWQTMPKIIKKGLPDNGRVFERQNGQRYFVANGMSTTDPAKVEAILGGTDPGKQSRDSFDQSVLNQTGNAAGFASQYLKGIPFVGQYVDEAMGSKQGDMRALQGAYERQHPNMSMAANIGSGVVNSAAALAALPAAVTGFLAGPTGMRMIPAMLRGGAVAAPLASVEGALSGYGSGTDPQSRADAAVSGAGYGLLGGAIAGAAAAPITRGIENLIGYVARSDIGKIASALGISSNAAKVIKNTFETGGDFGVAIQNLQTAGQRGMLADAGPAAQALLDASAASGGRAGMEARSAIENRASQSFGDMEGQLDTTLGPVPEGPKTKVAEIAARDAVPRKEAYDTAYGSPIPYGAPEGMAVEEVISRIPPTDLMDAISRANKDMVAEGVKDSPQIMAKIVDVRDAQGRVTGQKVQFFQQPNVRQLDYLKRGLQGQVEAGTDAMTGRLNSDARRSAMLSSQLRGRLGEAVPAYDAAVKMGGDTMEEMQAFKLGQSLLKSSTNAEDVMLTLGNTPSKAALETARAGVRLYLGKLVSTVRRMPSDPNLDARQLLSELGAVSSDDAKLKMTRLLGQAEASKLYGVIDEAYQTVKVRAAMATNSKTFQRGAVDRDVQQLTEPGIVGTAMQGEPINTTKSLIQAVTGQTAEFTAAQRQRVYADIARALTQKQGPEAMAALQLIKGAMDGQPLTDAQSRFIASLVGTSLATGATTGATQRGLLDDRQMQR